MKHRLAQWLRARADKLDPPATITVTVRPAASWPPGFIYSGSGNQSAGSYR